MRTCSRSFPCSLGENFGPALVIDEMCNQLILQDTHFPVRLYADGLQFFSENIETLDSKKHSKNS